MRVYGIFGWPIHHSLSPAMHNAAFRALGVDAVYVPLAVPPDKLDAALAATFSLGIDGLNLTVPHKQTAMACMDEVDSQARLIGAVNTVKCVQGRLFGSNTDAAGLIAALRENQVVLAGSRAVVIGAGGAARAAVVGLAHAGAEQICVLARRPEQADALITSLAPHFPNLTMISGELGAIQNHLPETTLLVQATSATLAPEAAAFVDALHLQKLPAHAVAVDLVYGKGGTAFTRRVQKHGIVAFDGTGMLLHQGALALSSWLEVEAPLAVMRSALA